MRRRSASGEASLHTRHMLSQDGPGIRDRTVDLRFGRVPGQDLLDPLIERQPLALGPVVMSAYTRASMTGLSSSGYGASSSTRPRTSTSNRAPE